MRSTGEVLGLSDTFGGAFFKAQDATQGRLPLDGNVVFTVADKDKADALPVARRFSDMGFTIKATKGTHEFLLKNNVKSELINKMHEKRPNVADIITNGDVQMVVNTPRGKASKADDSYIRKAAIRNKTPYVTTMAAALAAVKGIESFNDKPSELKSLHEYHEEL